MLASRPTLPVRPCPACGTSVEPLRAGRVILLVDGFRYFCDDACESRFRQGERSHDRARGLAVKTLAGANDSSIGATPPTTNVGATSEAALSVDRTSTLPRVVAPSDARTADVSTPRAALEDPRTWIAASAGAFLCALGSTNTLLAVLSAVLNGIAIVGGVVTFRARRNRNESLAWTLAPVGALVATVAAIVHSAETGTAWFELAGAAVASAALLLRSWLDERSTRPVSNVVEELVARLPKRVRIQVQSATDPMGGSETQLDATRIRTGEEILVHAGDTVAVDGIVKAGEASALLHPGARVATRRTAGDPLLAGARIVEGSVRLLAARVGDDRALVRPTRFRTGSDRDSAPIVRVALLVTRWGGTVMLGLAAAAPFVSSGHTLAMQLAACASVLLAAPLLAVKRAAELPLVAAAATAGERGIVFNNARSLERAGRVSVAALATRGTITEGRPEVVEIHSIDNSNVTPLIALAAAAESSAEDHAIAKAILRFAEARGVAPESVRRAQFLPGRGVTALAPGGEALVIGNRQLLLDEGVSVAVADAEATRAEAAGRTAIFLALGGRMRAVLAIEDDLRPGARSAVQRMMDQHIEVVLVSGDHRGTVEALARNLDIDHVRAQLLPDEQGTEVRRLGETGAAVAAIGRPVHDDAALAAANVPIVLGAAGGPAGERAVALATEDIRDAAAALWIARAARQGAWRGTLVAAAGGLVAAAAAFAGWAPPAISALIALSLDAYALPTGTRLLHRIALRLPARS